MRKTFAKLAKKVLLYLAIVTVFIIETFPIYWLAVSSLKNESEIIQATPSFIPNEITFSNYHYLIFQSEFMIFMRNSIIVSILTMFTVTLLSVCATYSIVRFRYPGRKIANRLILLTYLLPGALLFVPMFQLTQKFGLYDNILSLVIINVTFCAPFATFLLKAFFASLPASLEEAAMIDGCNRLQVLVRIIIPLAKAGIATVGIYAFLTSWGEYMFAAVLTTSQTSKTLPVGLASWMAMYSIDWGSLTTGAVLVTLPVLLLFAVMGRSFIQGLTAGAVKG